MYTFHLSPHYVCYVIVAIATRDFSDERGTQR